MKNKRGGFEMSITTMVILVMAVVMLILGLTLVRRIMGTATKSMDVIDAGVRSQLNEMFAKNEELSIALIYKEINIKRGTKGFIIPVGFNPRGEVKYLEYNVTIPEGGVDKGYCDSVPNLERWFSRPALNTKSSDFDKKSGNMAYLNIIVNVPETATKGCYVRVKVSEIESGKEGDYDTFQIKVI